MPCSLCAGSAVLIVQQIRQALIKQSMSWHKICYDKGVQFRYERQRSNDPKRPEATEDRSVEPLMPCSASGALPIVAKRGFASTMQRDNHICRLHNDVGQEGEDAAGGDLAQEGLKLMEDMVMQPIDMDCLYVCCRVKGLFDHGLMMVLRCRKEDDLALEVEDEAGEEFQHSGLKPTEDRFMRLDDMERFVRAAEQREIDDEDDEELTGDDSGNDHILKIRRHLRAEMCCI